MTIDVQGLSFSYGSHQVLRDISFAAGAGELIAVLGANGAGKSTLFRCILGTTKKYTGQIKLDGVDILQMSRRDIAAKLAYIPQTSKSTFNYTVLQSVLMGITNQLSVFGRPNAEHTDVVMDALNTFGIAHLAHCGCDEISGGEHQLSLLARAIVQRADTIIMDEPAANLDYGNQSLVMKNISELADRGYTVILSSHDPNQVFQHCTRTIAVSGGRIIFDGVPDSVLTEDALTGMYGVKVGRYSLRDEDMSVFLVD